MNLKYYPAIVLRTIWTKAYSLNKECKVFFSSISSLLLRMSFKTPLRHLFTYPSSFGSKVLIFFFPEAHHASVCGSGASASLAVRMDLLCRTRLCNDTDTFTHAFHSLGMLPHWLPGSVFLMISQCLKM